MKQVLIFAGDLKLRCMKVKSKDTVNADDAIVKQTEYVDGLSPIV